MSKIRKVGLVVVLMIVLNQMGFGQWVQDGQKLVGTGAIGSSNQGRFISISRDGLTMVSGGFRDDADKGAVWVWKKVGGVWTQDGTKLIGTGGVGNSGQGSVSLNGDGSVLAVGGFNDDGGKGAVWVWKKVGGVWTQDGAKLVGTGGVGNSSQGWYVSLSGDGGVLVSGAPEDDGQKGAVWVWKKVGGVWVQDGTKLVGTGVIGNAGQGRRLSISYDGSIFAVGGNYNNVGGAWIWKKVGGNWVQDGDKLVGSGGVDPSSQGGSVSLSGDGSVLAVGGFDDDGGKGAVWVWKKVGAVWVQDGTKLVGMDAVGNSKQGSSVSLNGDGSVLSVGAPGDNNNNGAGWIWKYVGGVWVQEGTKLVGSGGDGGDSQGISIYLSGKGDIVVLGGDYVNLGTGAVWVFKRDSTGTGVDLHYAGLNNKIFVYPNPSVDGRVFVEIDSRLRGNDGKGGNDVKVRVLDFMGREVKVFRFAQHDSGVARNDVSGGVELDLSEVPKGVYVVEVEGIGRGMVVRE